ncbi:hypothetical protein CEJ86_29860 [Sinorhizobium meliloti]|uniref:Uncharacterized protein n=2 Tax=Rhizobium meliloti TaxID=382 RepID=A0A2J0YU99_RHIML|nr:hypothetical protein CEJ86_29860 [Sinorhizobium meliloti]
MLGPLRAGVRKSAPPLAGSAGRFAILDPLVGSASPTCVIERKELTMTTVFGGCIEPEGYELSDDTIVTECTWCGGEAHQRFWETCEAGSINLNHTIICTVCGAADGDLDDSYFEGDEAARALEDEQLLAEFG